MQLANVVLAKRVNKSFQIMLKSRIITSAILLPLIILAILFLPPVFFTIILAIVFIMAAWEWTNLVGFTMLLYRWLYVIAIVLSVLLLLSLPSLLVTSVYLLLSLVWVWCLVAVIAYSKNIGSVGLNAPALRALLGFLVMIPSFAAMLFLKTGLAHPFWLLYILFVTFAVDIGGYFVGRWFGKTALSVRVSPKKTWQGFWGGIIFASINAIGWSFCLMLSTHQRFFVIFYALIAAAYSVVGDLIVSLLKRIVGLKDTGHIIPGHGGLLDRLDSIFAGTTVFVFLLIVFGLTA